MRALGSLLITILGFLLLAIVGVALFAAWSIGLGWLLAQLLPFTLFEGSLLMMLASIAVAYVGRQLLSTLPGNELPIEEEEISAFAYTMPARRFYQTEGDKTAEAWFRFQLANNILEDVADEPRVVRQMSPTQLEELAVRLTDVVVGVLKRKPKRTKRVAVTIGALQQEMIKTGQKPYDDDILQAAVSSVNALLFFDEEMADIVREKRWDEEMPDWDEE
jgi:hypothetical protein